MTTENLPYASPKANALWKLGKLASRVEELEREVEMIRQVLAEAYSRSIHPVSNTTQHEDLP